MMTLPKACSPKPASRRVTSSRPRKMSPSPSWLRPHVAPVVRRFTAVLALVSLLIPGPVAAAEARPGDNRVLIVTGIDYPGHKWRETTPVLVEALTNDARLRVDVLEDPYRLDTTDLSPYRAVFLHFMNWEKPDPNDKAKENLRGFVERGGGMVMIHFACGAFQGWPEFRNLAGRIYDRTNTHDPRGPFTVELANTNHAVTRGMTSFGVDDELYICLAGEVNIRFNLAGYEPGDARKCWDKSIRQPKVWAVCAGPISRPLTPIKMRGFQGFRYVIEPLW